jgi:hypothetical protein
MNLIEQSKKLEDKIYSLKTTVNNITITPIVYNGTVNFTISQNENHMGHYCYYKVISYLNFENLKELNEALTNILKKLESENA